jgi:hypothetical protein
MRTLIGKDSFSELTSISLSGYTKPIFVSEQQIIGMMMIRAMHLATFLVENLINEHILNGNYFSVFSLYTLNSKITCKSIGFIRLANRHTDIYKRSMKRCTVYIVTILLSAWLVLTIFTCVGLLRVESLQNLLSSG